MSLNANKVIKVNGEPYLVKRIVRNIKNYDETFLKTVLKNTGSEYHVVDNNGNAFFCTKIPTYELNQSTNKWTQSSPAPSSPVYDAVPSKIPKRKPRTVRNKKLCKKY